MDWIDSLEVWFKFVSAVGVDHVISISQIVECLNMVNIVVMKFICFAASLVVIE